MRVQASRVVVRVCSGLMVALLGTTGLVAAQDSLNVVGIYPLPWQPLTDTLVMYFDRDIEQPEDAATAPFTIEPELIGTYQFGSNYIEFTPASGALRSRTVYQVSPSPTLRAKDGSALSEPTQTFSVTNHTIKFQSADLMDFDDTHITLKIQLNEMLDGTSVNAQTISVADAGGQPVEFAVVLGSNPGSVTLNYSAEAAVPVTVTIHPGISSEDQQFKTAKPHTLKIPSSIPLTVRSANWVAVDNEEDLISIRFSGDVDSGKLSEYVSVVDPVTGKAFPFKSHSSSTHQEKRITLTEAVSERDQLELRVAKGLYSRQLMITREDQSYPLRSQTSTVRTMQPQNIQYHNWRNNGSNGVDLELVFTLDVNVTALKDRVIVEPAIEGMELVPGNYSRSMLIRGEFKPTESYQVRVERNPEGTPEGAESEARVLRLSPGMPPEASGVRFTGEGKYFFPRSKPGMLKAQARNIEKSKATVYRLFPNNIVPAMQYISGENVWQSFNENFTKSLGEMTINFPVKKDERVVAPVDLTGILSDSSKGVYSVQLENHDGYADTKIVVWTDIGAVAHWQDNALALYAHNLYTLEPIAGASVVVHSNKNQVLASGVTDSNGILLLRDLEDSDGVPKVATIETPDDFSFVELRTRDAQPDEFNSAVSPFDANQYDSLIYADRNIYRPGETAHFRWLVRTQYGDALANIPLLFVVTNPQGQDVLSQPVTLSEFGTGFADLDTKKTFATGVYNAHLRIPGSKTSLQTIPINVEDFVPNKIETTILLPDQIWLPNTPQVFDVQAENLFGGPASGRKSEGSVILRKGAFASEQWKGLHFGNDAVFETIVQSLGEQQTDENGRAQFTFTATGDINASSPLSVTIRGRVFELGGRTVGNTAEATLFPSTIALGIGGESTDQGNSIKVRVAAIQPDESPANLEAVRVYLERQTWHYTIRHMHGQDQSWWERSYEPIEEVGTALVNGVGEANFTLPHYGQFRLRVQSDATTQYSTLSFYKYGKNVQLSSSSEPSLVTLTLDRDTYHVGYTAKLQIESPYPGRAIVCVQGEEINELHTVDLVDNRATIDIPLLAAYAPNVWAEVTIVHEEGDGKTHPYASFSVVNVPVLEAHRRLTITYPELPEEVRPAGTVPVKIHVAHANGKPARAEITLAAVDEGIHAILQYADPDPASWFERSRRPDYNRATYYDRVAYDFDPSEIGGGMLEKRLGCDSGVEENWIKPLALWSGSVVTDAEGNAVINLDLPEFSGKLRLLTVASGTEASGATSAPLFVRRPYMLRTSMPRFVLPGDTFDCSAVLFNTTPKGYTARIQWASSGALNGSEEQRQLALPPTSDRQIIGQFTAGSSAGQGNINWRVEIIDEAGAVVETITESAPIPVLHPTTYQTDHELGVLMPGESRTYQNDVFVANELAGSLISVTADPMTRLSKAMKYVARYPYGCVEQTTSACMPLYLLQQHEELIESALENGVDVQSYLQDGIDRLFSMQTSDGGLAYWPGGYESNAYGSIYACHFLTLIKDDTDFNLSQDRFNELQQYVARLTNRVENGSTEELYRRAYATYVLALDGKLDTINDINRFDTLQVPTSGRYLLAAALALSTKDQARADTYLKRYPQVAYSKRETSGNFNSSIRGVAIELMTLIDVSNDQSEMIKRVDQLVRFIQVEKYPNTQEFAFVSTALGRYLDRYAPALDTASATIEHSGASESIAGSSVYSHTTEGNTVPYRITNTGAMPVYINYTTSGIPKVPQLQSISEGIRITRSLRVSGNSNPKLSQFKHGDSYLATLSITCAQAVENVVVADLLPAGFEIENPRIDEDVLLTLGIEEQGIYPAYLDVRDDRLILAFDRLDGGTNTFYYVVRAVTPGTFQHPGVVAECMYDAKVRGRSALSAITITREGN